MKLCARALPVATAKQPTSMYPPFIFYYTVPEAEAAARLDCQRMEYVEALGTLIDALSGMGAPSLPAGISVHVGVSVLR